MIKSGGHTPTYFHTVYPLKANLMSSTLLIGCQNNQLTVSQWFLISYKELMADPSLVQSFLEDEWMSVHGLPYLHAIHFYIVSERLFIWLTSSVLWRKAGAHYIMKVERRATSVEIAPLAIMVMDGVDEGSKGGTFGHTFNHSPVGLTQARCSKGEGLHWFAPSSMGVLKIPLLVCNHPFSGHFNHQIPTVPTVFAHVALLFSQSYHPSTRKRGRWAKK